MQIRRISTFEDFVDLKSQWNELLENAEPNILFLHHSWLTIWWDCFARPDWEMLVLLVYDDRHLVGAVPLIIKSDNTGLTRKHIEFFANSHTFRTDFLVHKNFDRNEIIEIIWNYLCTQIHNWDLIKLKDIPVEFKSMDKLQLIVAATGHEYSMEEKIESPYLSINSGWDIYFESRSKNHRKNMRRAIKKIEETGKWKFQVLENIPDLSAVLETGFKIENSGWKGANDSSILSTDQVTKFYKRIAEEMNKNGWLNLFFLELNGEKIAFDFCINYRKRIYALKTGYEEKYAMLSPGQIMQMTELQYYFTQEISEYDFIGPKVDFKMRWTDELREHWTFYIYGRTWRGKIFKLWNKSLLPILRKIKLLQKLKNGGQ